MTNNEDLKRKVITLLTPEEVLKDFGRGSLIACKILFKAYGSTDEDFFNHCKDFGYKFFKQNGSWKPYHSF